MKKSMAILVITGVFLAVCSSTNAGPQIIDNETDLFAASLNIITYDFEESSGFPIEQNYIGTFCNINFDAQINKYSDPTSGTQCMTGQTGAFSIATLDFSNCDTAVFGFGFYGLDLTHSSKIHTQELIRVLVSYKTGAQSTYDVMLPAGVAELTPVYFGLIGDGDPIESIQLFGTDLGKTYPSRAWVIDDLTIVVPEPATLTLLAIGALTLLRRRKT